MQEWELLGHVDHTLLTPTATWAQIEALCREGIQYKTASVCIPSCYVGRAARAFGDQIPICTVVGFPLGYETTEAKAAQTRQALEEGASEIDMVINLCHVKNGDFDRVKQEIGTLKQIVGDQILKVIVEACYLDEGEKIAMCRAVTEAGADYIKTSTGFGTGGATLSDVELFAKHIGENVKIKAAGGIRSLEQMEAFLEAGASRIGSSSAVKLVREYENRGQERRTP